MKVLSVASEVYPLIKTGGLADVAGIGADSATTLVAGCDHDRLELAVVRDGRAVFTHAARLSDEGDIRPMIRSEISRALFAVGNQFGGLDVDIARATGTRAELLAEVLAERLADTGDVAPVELFSPASRDDVEFPAEQSSRDESLVVAAAVGLLLASVGLNVSVQVGVLVALGLALVITVRLPGPHARTIGVTVAALMLVLALDGGARQLALSFGLYHGAPGYADNDDRGLRDLLAAAHGTGGGGGVALGHRWGKPRLLVGA